MSHRELSSAIVDIEMEMKVSAAVLAGLLLAMGSTMLYSVL